MTVSFGHPGGFLLLTLPPFARKTTGIIGIHAFPMFGKSSKLWSGHLGNFLELPPSMLDRFCQTAAHSFGEHGLTN